MLIFTSSSDIMHRRILHHIIYHVMFPVVNELFSFFKVALIKYLNYPKLLITVKRRTQGLELEKFILMV